MKTILIYIALVVLFVVIIFVFVSNNKKVEVVPNSSSDVEDKMIVENYIRNNIKTIAPEKAVLGGSWYVVSVDVNPSMKNGIMVYEDGHIQGKASFNYVRNGEEVLISGLQSIK